MCFEDASSFIESSQACAFGKVEFDKIFKGTCTNSLTILNIQH